MTAPLAGIRVVEIASFVAVPACATMLADLGAEVIKVEVPWGELYRHAPPRMAGYDSDFPLGPGFNMDNRGKRSLALDLELVEARDALHRVIARADIVLMNLLPARAEKYGLSPAELQAKHPRMIIGCLSGFGPLGERANEAAFDYSAFWSHSGLMDSTRDVDADPSFMRPGMGDHSAGLSLSVGILAALRMRDASGQGQIVQVALQQVGFYVNGNDSSSALVTGQSPPRHDRRAPRNPLWNHYRCADDRWIFLVMIDSNRYWPLLAKALSTAIGQAEWLTDARFADAVSRYENSRELVARLDAVFVEKTIEEWAGPLSSERVIWAPVRSMAEAVADPVAEQNGAFVTVEHPEVGPFRSIAPPFKLSAHPMTGSVPAPAVGADSRAVLEEAGVDPATIEWLVAAHS